MIRGTTPTHTFTLPFLASEITCVYVTYAKNGTVKIEKPITACDCNENKLIVRLTQEETLSLRCNCMTEIQIAARVGDTVLRSQIIQVPTERILKEEAI